MTNAAYMLCGQRRVSMATDSGLAAYVTDRLSEGLTPEAGRLLLGVECGLCAVSAETICRWI